MDIKARGRRNRIEGDLPSGADYRTITHLSLPNRPEVMLPLLSSVHGAGPTFGSPTHRAAGPYGRRQWEILGLPEPRRVIVPSHDKYRMQPENGWKRIPEPMLSSTAIATPELALAL